MKLDFDQLTQAPEPAKKQPAVDETYQGLSYRPIPFKSIKEAKQAYGGKYQWICSSANDHAGLEILVGRYNWDAKKLQLLIDQHKLTISFAQQTYETWLKK